MAKQRYKRIRAGRLVREVLWTPVFPGDLPAAREAKTKVSSEARRKLNQKASWKKLMLLLAANPDMVTRLTLTYDDAHLPKAADGARKLIKKALSELRGWMRESLGAELKYVYNIEGRHTGGRLHHHIVLNLPPSMVPVLETMWPNGSVHDDGAIEPESYAAAAQYLTKEAREDGAPVGARSWVPSKGLAKPEEPPAEWVPDNVRLQPPINAHVIETDYRENEWGRIQYLEYLLPEPPKERPVRPRRRKKNMSL